MADNDDADEPTPAEPPDATAADDPSVHGGAAGSSEEPLSPESADTAAQTAGTATQTADTAARTPYTAGQTPDIATQTPHTTRQMPDPPALPPHTATQAPGTAGQTPDTAPLTSDTTERTSDSAVRTSDSAAADESDSEAAEPRRLTGRFSKRVLAWTAAAVVTAALAAVTATLTVQHRTATREQADRAAYLQAARQAVVDLTTISSGSADADIARILAASTGVFHDDFGSRSAAFTSVVKQAHVSTTGTVTAAGIESMSGDDAKVLVAATSRVTNSTGANNEPRVWRLRVTLHRDQGRVLVSNVDFVP